MTRAVAALTGAAVSVLVGAAAAAGTAALTAVLLAAVVAVASGWATLLSLPTPRGSTAVIAFGGAVAVTVAAMTTTAPYLRWLPSVLAVALLVEFGHQLFRRDMRPRLVESVTGVVSGVVVVAMASGWLASLHADPGAGLVLAGAAAALGASAAVGLPWPQRVSGPTAVAAAAVLAALTAAVHAGAAVVLAGLTGAAVGAVVAAMDRLLAHLPTTRQLPAALARGTAPVAASGFVVYTLGRFLS